jgi:DNA-binding transcriptional MocR family regulator
VLPDLVAAVADDWPYAAQAFTVTDGAMDAIELIARSTIGFGDRVVVEHPVFPPLLDLLESLGTQLVGMPLDGQGPDPHALSDALRVPTAAVVLQPRAQNPTGVSMSSERAEELAAVLADRDTLIIEDDSAGAIATAPALSLGRWLPERTLHVRSYSKSHGPDLRLAVVSGPSDLVDQLTARRQLGQGWSSRLLQHILLYLLTDTRAREQVAAARLAYARRRNAAVNQLREHGLLLGAVDGINLWIPVADEAAALVRLASQGVGVAPGAPFAVLQDHSPHVRVTIGLIDPEREPITELLAQAATRTGGWGRAR